MANEGCAQLKVSVQKYVVSAIENAGLAWPQNKILFWVIISWAWETVASFHREFSYCSCPGFSWDTVDFLPSSWCDPVLWLYKKGSVHKQWCCSCCWAVLYRAKDVSASHITLPSRMLGKAQVAERGQNQDNWPKLARGTFHTMWHHAELLNWRRLAGVLLQLWNWQGVSQHMVSNCVSLVL